MPTPARTVAILVLILTAAAPAAHASAAAGPLPEAGAATSDCASPPCGYIWPRLALETDVRSPYPSAAIPDFPASFEVTVTYSWDLEQEGTGISDPTQEMEILILISRTPTWLSATLDQSTCSFQLVPVITEYEVCTVTVTTRLDPEHFPATEEELRDFGHRLMLFASSEESGTFMPSYGLEDIRFRWDEPPAGANEVRDRMPDAGTAEAAAPALLLGLLGVTAALAALRRRRA